MSPYQNERDRMVEFQVARRGVSDERVLAAMRKVPRHAFIPKDAQKIGYVDSPIRIGCGQTISQPDIVGLMTELLSVEPDHAVLDVGTGSGYQAAILGELAGVVHSIERHAELAAEAERHLRELGYQNVHVHVGDGTQGYPPAVPFDRILVAAAAPEVPPALKSQLSDNGRLVIPVGSRYSQRLEVWDRDGESFQRSENIPVVFVPLVGREGWEE